MFFREPCSQITPGAKPFFCARQGGPNERVIRRQAGRLAGSLVPIAWTLRRGILCKKSLGREDLLDGLQGTEHDAVAYADQAPPAHGLDDRRLEELRPGHPAGLGCWTFVVSTRELDPLPVVRE